jgi:hypothetical protein
MSDEQVVERLLKGFSTSTAEDVNELADKTMDPSLQQLIGDIGSDTKLDLVEFVSLLMIPRLQREALDHIDGRASDTISYVFKMLIHDAIDSDDQATVPLSKATLERMFRCFGEVELAQDQDLMQEMINQARTDEDEENHPTTILTADVFARALTKDLGAYDPSLSTDRLAAMLSEPHGHEKTNMATQSDSKSTDPIVASSTLSSIDFVADTYSWQLLSVTMWVFFGMSFFTYYSGVGNFITNATPMCADFQSQGTWNDNLGAFGCTIGWSISRWLYIVGIMGGYGQIFFGLSGLGNGVKVRNAFLPLVAAVAAGTMTLFPLFIEEFERSNQVMDIFPVVATTIFGLLVVLLNMWSAFSLAVLRDGANKMMKDMMTPSTVRTEMSVSQAGARKLDRLIEGALRMHSKKDASLAIDSHAGQALMNYSNDGDRARERVGGIRWAWKKIWNRELFELEGLWLSGRLISINVSQFLLAFFLLSVGLAATAVISREYKPPETGVEALFEVVFDLKPGQLQLDKVMRRIAQATTDFVVEDIPNASLNCNEAQDMSNCTLEDVEACAELAGSWLCAVVEYTQFKGDAATWQLQEELLRLSGYPVDLIFSTSVDAFEEAAKQSVSTLYPTETYMIFVPLLCATLAAFGAAVTAAIAMIPSAVSTLMRYRCGLIDLMNDPKHRLIRAYPEQVALLRGTRVIACQIHLICPSDTVSCRLYVSSVPGAMFWGTLFSGGLMGVVVGGLMFLVVWQVTSSVFQKLIALLIGVVVVIVLQYLFVRASRSWLASKAYYRSRPGTANILLLLQECAFFALTIGFTLVRTTNIIVVTILFVGRVDRPFLADGIGEIESLGFRLDSHPYIFAMDILQHEAHRHPYIELFGSICLFKLRHGTNFATRAGAAWRLLFVMMMMPWLAKYRRLCREVGGEDDVDAMLFEYQRLKEGETEGNETTVAELTRQIRLLTTQLGISRAARSQEQRRRSSNLVGQNGRAMSSQTQGRRRHSTFLAT